MAEQITTPEALDALPADSILRDNDGLAVWRDPHLGWCAGNMTRDIPTDLLIADGAPLTVLFRPDAPAPSAEDREALTGEDLEAALDALAEAGVATAALDALAPWLAARQPAPVDAETVKRGVLAARWPNGDLLTGVTSRTAALIAESVVREVSRG